MRIQSILISEYLADLAPLFAEQQAEIGEDYTIGLPLVPDPDVERYAMLDQSGMAMALGVFDDADQIVGYSNNLISESLHYQNVYVCQNDAIYLRKDHRHGSMGLRLIRETERQAKARGADIMVWHAKPYTNFDRVLERLQYAVQETVYTRALHHGH